MSGEKKKHPVIAGILTIAILLIAGSYFFGGGVEKQALKSTESLYSKVAADQEESYRIAKESGSAIDAYVQAGIVAAGYLQAKDEVNYKKWKAIEKEEAKLAGMSTE